MSTSDCLPSLFQGWTGYPCLSLVFPGLPGRNSTSDLLLGVEKEKTGHCLVLEASQGGWTSGLGI